MSDLNLNLFRRQHQRGAALIISLTFLLLLTVLGVAAMRSATLQERMAGNSRDDSVAMQSAEYGVQQAEAVLGDANFSPTNFVNSKPGFVAQIANGASAAVWAPPFVWDVTTSQQKGLTDTAGALQANFVIEQFTSEANLQEKTMNSQGKSGQRGVPQFNKTTSYRITSRGIGQGNTIVILQEVYRRNEQ